MMYQCGRCGLTRASGQVMGLAMPQCQCPWEFNSPVAQTPPQRTWVGLTDEEIWATISRIGTSDSDVNPYAKLADARAIEAKLKEKNT